MMDPAAGARPYVFCNLAMSADGKIDSARREGGGFSSRADRDRLDAYRAEADALVVGAETIRAEDPPLAVRDPGRVRRRLDEGRAERLHVVVLSRSGGIPPGARFLREPAASRRLAVPEDLPDDAVAPLGGAVSSGTLSVLRAGRGSVDLGAVVSELAAAGCRKVVVEGGGEVVAAFLRAGLLDEVRLTVVPTIIGGRDAPTPVGGAGLPLSERVALSLVALDRVGDELYLRYRVGQPRAPRRP